MASRLDRYAAEYEDTRKLKEQAVERYQDKLRSQLSGAIDAFTGSDRDSEVVRQTLSAVHDSIGSGTVFGFIRSYLAYAGLVIKVDGDDMAALAHLSSGPLAPEPKPAE
jgi:hypothetical protein